MNTTTEFSTVKLNYNKNIPVTGTDLDVAGYGLIGGFVYPNYLHEVTLQAISNVYCKDTYKDYKWQVNGYSNLCGGITGIGGKGVCYNDAGGPVVVSERGGTNAIQVGIFSWHVGCGLKPTNPSVFTRVSYYRKFIVETMKKYCST
jgi:secreted trypsin-like serine protease